MIQESTTKDLFTVWMELSTRRYNVSGTFQARIVLGIFNGQERDPESSWETRIMYCIKSK